MNNQNPTSTTRRRVLRLGLAGVPALRWLSTADDQPTLDAAAVHLTADDVPVGYRDVEYDTSDSAFLESLRERTDGAVEPKTTNRFYPYFSDLEYVGAIGSTVLRFDGTRPAVSTIHAAVQDSFAGFGEELAYGGRWSTDVTTDGDQIEWHITVPNPAWEHSQPYLDTTRLQVVGPAILVTTSFGELPDDRSPRNAAREFATLMRDRATAQLEERA